MRDWNVVATVHEEQFGRACAVLQKLGKVKRTDFHNVLVMKVRDVRAFADRLAEIMAAQPDLAGTLSRVVPATNAFDFHTPEEFDTAALAIAKAWLPQLANRSFHVRLHRRGLKGQLIGQPHDQSLDRALLTALGAAGTPARISFDDPDAVIDIETVGNRAGISFWNRGDLRRYPFLKID